MWPIFEAEDARVQIFRSCISSVAGGILIAIRHSYCDIFDEVVLAEVYKGRILAVSLRTGELWVVFVCVHIHTFPNDMTARLDMLKQLHNFCSERHSHLIFIFGDFNFITDHTDRTKISNGLSVGKCCGLGKFWNEHFGIFAEAYQQSHTRHPNKDDGDGSSARLDRLYFNGPPEAFLLWDVVASTVGQTPDHYLSDHLPYVAKFGYKYETNSVQSILGYITK